MEALLFVASEGPGEPIYWVAATADLLRGLD